MPDISLGPVPGGSGELRAYLARPAGNGPWPAVVAIHELFGVDDVLRRQCDRLAAAGYLTIGPNLFSDGGPRRCIVSTMRALRSGQGKPFADIEAARRYVLASGSRESSGSSRSGESAGASDSTGKVGIIGFCMGGAFALVTANQGSFEAASVNYGALPPKPDEALAGACPIVASYGKKDRLMTGQAAKLDKTLTRLGVEHDLKVYDDAGHSFLNDEPNGPKALRPFAKIMNIGPEPVAAADAWRRIESFFATHLAS